MRLLVHLSDIHFGAEDPPIVAAVQRYVQELQPHVTVISGDLTQRAKRGQFRAAREFLRTLPGPQIIVPGNHDVPLWNVWARFIHPLTRYKSIITTDLQPTFQDDEVAVIGLNTARSFTRKNGRINEHQVDDACRWLDTVPPHVLKIVVTHHPFDLNETYRPRELVGRAAMGMKRLAASGAGILLAGHLHEAYTGGTAQRYPLDGYSALVVQAGTATSWRRRKTPNSFNVLRLEPPNVTVEVLEWDEAAAAFRLKERKSYQKVEGHGFARLEAASAEAT